MEDLYKQARISRVNQCTKLAVHETGFACRPSRSADEQVHFSTSDNVTPSVPSPNATWICFLLSLSRTLFLLSIRAVALCTTSSQQSQPAFIQTSSSLEYPHSISNMSVVSISVFLIFFCFLRFLWGRWWVHDHPQENFAKFSYRSERPVRTYYCLNMASSSTFLIMWEEILCPFFFQKTVQPNLATSQRGGMLEAGLVIIHKRTT